MKLSFVHLPIVVLLLGAGVLAWSRIAAYRPVILPLDAKLVLHEGLPHPLNDGNYNSELKKAHYILKGHAFYDTQPVLSASDAVKIAELLNEQATYRPYREPKQCGGFHPDFAVEYVERQQLFLLCFGCHEVMIFDGSAEQIFDISEHAYNTLQKLLESYQLSRPRGRAFH
jgi:hypothetical protein